MKGLKIHAVLNAPELSYATVRGVKITNIKSVDWYQALYKADSAIAYIREKVFKAMPFARFARVEAVREDDEFKYLNKSVVGRFNETNDLKVVKEKFSDDGGPLLDGRELPPNKVTISFVPVSKISQANV